MKKKKKTLKWKRKRRIWTCTKSRSLLYWDVTFCVHRDTQRRKNYYSINFQFFFCWTINFQFKELVFILKMKVSNVILYVRGGTHTEGEKNYNSRNFQFNELGFILKIKVSKVILYFIFLVFWIKSSFMTLCV